MSTKRHTLGMKAETHGKVDLLNFSRSCVPVDAKDLVGVVWGILRSRCMEKSLQGRAYERGHKNRR